MPGDPHGIQDWMPTIADVMKTQGYATGQFGKNHLGDRDEHLPTKHGFDEFFGNLYHLNAEEEPEGYFYPKDPNFRKQFGPRGVIKSTADGKIEDTGPLNTARMPTVDEEFPGGSQGLHRPAGEGGQAVLRLVQLDAHARLHPPEEGIAGQDRQGHPRRRHGRSTTVWSASCSSNSTTSASPTTRSSSIPPDNGAEIALWPDGRHDAVPRREGHDVGRRHAHPDDGALAGRGEARHAIQRDHLADRLVPDTLPQRPESPDIKEKMKTGFAGAGGKSFKVHLDGYNFMPFFKGEKPRRHRAMRSTISIRAAISTRSAGTTGSSALPRSRGNIATATREVPAWSLIANLRMDPYERGMEEGGGAMEFLARNMWLIVPVQGKIKEFFSDFDQFPYQEGSTLNASGINYDELTAGCDGRLNDIERLKPR